MPAKKTRQTQVSSYYKEAFVSNGEVVLNQLRHQGINIESLREDELMHFDQFDHVGEIKNTQMLADIVHLERNMQILDVGGGMGGAARYLAHKYGCRVHVGDLIFDRCRDGLRLTQLAGLNHRVTFHAADAYQLPFREGIFDLIWSQDVFDSVENKDSLLKECRRVLQPAGELIFTDHLQGPTEAVPDGIYLWPQDTHPLSFNDYRVLLNKHKFKVLEEIDLTNWALSSMKRVVNAIKGSKRNKILKAQGSNYYTKLIAFTSSFTGYLESGAIQYGAFKASRR